MRGAGVATGRKAGESDGRNRLAGSHRVSPCHRREPGEQSVRPHLGDAALASAPHGVADHDLVSSYTVDKTVIDALLTAAVRWSEDSPVGFSYHWYEGDGRVDAGTATAVGQMLWHANWYHADGWVKATDQVEDVPEPVYVYEPLPGVPAPLVVLRLIDNYTYQTAGEPEEWRPTEPFGFVHALRGAAISRLPGYGDLPWTLGEADRDIYLRLGGSEPEVEPLPVDADDPDWVELNASLVGTGVPFEVMSPEERRKEAKIWSEPLLRGHWLARWPDSSRPAVVVTLHASDEAARAAFDHEVEIARQASTPRDSREILRRGQTVVMLATDHWNAAADDWLTQTRNVFADAEAMQLIPRRSPGANSGG
jgi:hypothetical protein